jgi:hypothetical protein
MRLTIAIFLLAFLLQAATIAPALAQMCDTRCDEGEVWTEMDGGTCIERPKPMSRGSYRFSLQSQ